MAKARIFIKDDAISGVNEFSEIINEHFSIHANNIIVLGGITVKVRKIMKSIYF